MKMNKTTIFILISFYVLCNAKKTGREVMPYTYLYVTGMLLNLHGIAMHIIDSEVPKTI